MNPDDLAAELEILKRRLYASENAPAWVTEKRLIELIGLEPNVPRSRVQRGTWTEGVHWKTVEGVRGRLFNVREIDAWHATQESARPRRDTASRSGSNTEGSPTRRRSTSPRLKLV